MLVGVRSLLQNFNRLPATTGLLAAGLSSESRREYFARSSASREASEQEPNRDSRLSFYIEKALECNASFRTDKYAQAKHAQIFDFVLSRPAQVADCPTLSRDVHKYLANITKLPSAVWTSVVPKALSMLVVLRAELAKLDSRRPHVRLWLNSPITPLLEQQMCERLLDKIAFTPEKALGALRSYVEWANKNKVPFWTELPDGAVSAITANADTLFASPECTLQALQLADSLLGERTPNKSLVNFFLEGLNAHSAATSLDSHHLLGFFALGTRLGLFARQPTSAQYLFDLMTEKAHLDPRGVYKTVKQLASSRFPPLTIPPGPAAVLSRVLQRGLDRIPTAERAGLREMMLQLDLPISPQLEMAFARLSSSSSITGQLDDLQLELRTFLAQVLEEKLLENFANAGHFFSMVRSHLLTKPTRATTELLLSCFHVLVLSLPEPVGETEHEAETARQALAIMRVLAEIGDDDLLDFWMVEDTRFQRLWITLLDMLADGAKHLSLQELGLLAHCTGTSRLGLLYQPLVTHRLFDALYDCLRDSSTTLSGIAEFVFVLSGCKNLLPVPSTIQADIINAVAARVDQQISGSTQLGDVVLALQAINVKLPTGIRKAMLRQIEHYIGGYNLDMLLKIFTVLVPPGSELDRSVDAFANVIVKMEHSLGRYNPVGMLLYLTSFDSAPLGVDGQPHKAIPMLCRRIEDIVQVLHPDEAKSLVQRQHLITAELAQRLLKFSPEGPSEPRPKPNAVPLSFAASKGHLTAIHLLTEFVRSFDQPNGSNLDDSMWCLEQISANPMSLVATDETTSGIAFLYTQLDTVLDQDPRLAAKIASFAAAFDSKRWVLLIPEVRDLHLKIFKILLDASIVDMNILLELVALTDPPMTKAETERLVDQLFTRASTMGSRQTAKCLHFLASISPPLPETKFLTHRFWCRILANPQKLRGSDFAKTFMALDKLGYQPTQDEVLSLGPTIVEQADTFTSHNLTSIWIGLANLNIYPGDRVFDALAPRCVKNIGKLHQQQRNDLLRAWLKLGIPSSNPEFRKIRK